MRIWALSDLHIEKVRRPWSLADDMAGRCDVVVLAGDVSTPLTAGLEWLAGQRDAGVFGNARIVMVAGNHEFYGADIDVEAAEGIYLARELGIDLLERSAVVIGSVRFLGCTLWTDYELYGDPARAMAIAGRVVNDHKHIRTTAGAFRPEDALARHVESRDWLKAASAQPHDGPTVIVTHHGVSLKSVHPKWTRTIPVSAAFSSDLVPLIKGTGAAVWFHGHTHDNFDYTIGSTRVICNPKGYGPDALGNLENPAFDPRLIVEVG